METPPTISAIRVTSGRDIGMLVKAKRKQQPKLTQAILAKGAGVGIRFISDLENGKATVQLDKMMRVLAYLNITLYIH